MMRVGIAVAVAGILATAAWGDVIEMKDGTSYSGVLYRAGDTGTITTDKGEAIVVKTAEVTRVVTGGTSATDRDAAMEWGRLQSKFKDAPTVQAVADQVQKFLDKYGTTSSAPSAKAALAHYQELAGANPILFHARWMSQADKAALVKGWRAAAQGALDAYNAGHFREALDGSKALLEKDKENTDALAIAGLASIKLATSAPARNYFASLAALDATTPLAENNLGAICFQQKQYPEGLTHFLKAMQIDSGQRTLVDNVAEAINTYLTSNGDRNSTTYVALRKLFDAAETQMEAKMAAQGMVRLGGGWVTQAEADKTAKKREDLQKIMDARDAEYQKARADLAKVEQQIQRCQMDYLNANANVAQLQAQVNTSRRAGRIDTALNGSLDLAMRDAMRLQQEGQAATRERDEIQAEIKEIMAEVPKLKAQAAQIPNGFTGKWSMIELDEGDGIQKKPAASQPATLPASTNPVK